MGGGGVIRGEGCFLDFRDLGPNTVKINRSTTQKKCEEEERIEVDWKGRA